MIDLVANKWNSKQCLQPKLKNPPPMYNSLKESPGRSYGLSMMVLCFPQNSKLEKEKEVKKERRKKVKKIDQEKVLPSNFFVFLFLGFSSPLSILRSLNQVGGLEWPNMEV